MVQWWYEVVGMSRQLNGHSCKEVMMKKNFTSYDDMWSSRTGVKMNR